MRRQLNLETYIKCMEVVFLIAIAFLTFSYFGGYYLIITTIGKHSKLLERMAWVLLLCKVCGTRYNKKEFLVLSGLTGLAILTYKQSTNPEMLLNLLVVAAMKNVDIRKLLKVSLFTLVFAVLLIGVCSFFGYGGPVQLTQMYGREGMETRYCFGFIHPNQWSHAMFMMLLFYVLSYWEQLDLKKIGILFLGNLLVYYFSVSKTAFLAGMVLLGIVIFCRYFREILWSEKVIGAEFLVTAVVWWISLLAIQQNRLGVFLIQHFNRIFTGRFSNAKIFYQYYGQSWLGMQVADVHPETGGVLDMGYIRFLLENGWVWFVILFVLVILLVRFAAKHRRESVLAVIFCILLYAFSEAVSFLQVPANVIFYYLGVMLYEHRDEFVDTEKNMC